MAIATQTTAPSRSNAEGNAITLKGQVLTTALPLPTAKPQTSQTVAPLVSKARTQLVIDKEKLLEDQIVLEELPQALEANAMGDVLMAQASVPAAGAATGGAAATTATVAAPSVAATAATATGFAGMSGLGLLGAVAGVVGVAAVANSGGSDAPSVPAVPLFLVTDVANVVTFGGTAIGDTTVSIDGTAATFSRGGVTATAAVDSLSNKIITVAEGQTLLMTGAQMALTSVQGVTINGAGNFKIDANDAGEGDITNLVFAVNVALTGAEGVHFYTQGKAITSRWLDPSHGGINLGFPQNV